MKLKNHSNFKEMRYTKSEWFSKFTLGHDEPGGRNWLDDGEKKLGGNETDVEYHINRYRYRDNLEPGNNMPAAFGCSYTFGYGVNNPWPKLIGVANCGQNGASNDMITRLAISYCETFKPSEIYVLWTFAHRREHINEQGGLEKYRNMSTQTLDEEFKNKTWRSSYLELSNIKADQYNLAKNRLLLNHYCSIYNIALNEASIFDMPKNEYPLARDNDHPGTDWHTNMAVHLCE
jgi:hypothetical protein